MTDQNPIERRWQKIFWLGGAAAISAVLVGIIEIAITFLPGGNAPHETVLDWFHLYQDNWFLGMRNLGLLNILLNLLAIPTYLALYGIYRNSEFQPYAGLVAITSFIGIAVFLATNRAFAMLDLSAQYTAASSEAQRAMLEAAGQSMLSVGASHSPGTFLGFSLSEIAGIMISVVMLRSVHFSKATAYAGMIGFSILLVFELISSFMTGLTDIAMILAMVGGLLSMTWYVLVGVRLFQYSHQPA